MQLVSPNKPATVRLRNNKGQTFMSASKNSLDPVQILCLDCDGVGPEITAVTRRVWQAVDNRFDLNLTFTTQERLVTC